MKNDKTDNISGEPPETTENANVTEIEHSEEQGGPKYPEPTRYGDWERKGRVSDF